MKLKHLIIGLAALAMSSPVTAQERQDTIVVTGSRIDIDNLKTAPNIFQSVRADFVQVELNYSTGSRQASERRSELSAMYNRLLETVDRTEGYSLLGGDVGYATAPIETVLFSDVFRDYNSRAQFSLTLNIDTRPNETFEALFERAEAFVESIPLEGRAEAYLDDEQYLGARNTSRYRTALLSNIKAEADRLKSLFAPAEVTIQGLESRIITQPSGPLELEIFIPYEMSVETGD